MTDDILLDYRITNDHGKFVAIDSTDEVVGVYDTAQETSVFPDLGGLSRELETKWLQLGLGESKGKKLKLSVTPTKRAKNSQGRPS